MNAHVHVLVLLDEFPKIIEYIVHVLVRLFNILVFKPFFLLLLPGDVSDHLICTHAGLKKRGFGTPYRVFDLRIL